MSSTEQQMRDEDRRNDRNRDDRRRTGGALNPSESNPDGTPKLPADTPLSREDIRRDDVRDGVRNDRGSRNPDGTARFPVDENVRSGDRNSDGTLKQIDPAFRDTRTPQQMDTSRIENVRIGSKISLPHEGDKIAHVTRVYTAPAGQVESVDATLVEVDNYSKAIYRRKVLAGDFKLEN